MDNKAFEGDKKMKGDLESNIKTDYEKVKDTWIPRKKMAVMVSTLVVFCCIFAGIMYHILEVNKKEMQLEIRTAISKLKELNNIKNKGADDEMRLKLRQDDENQNVLPADRYKTNHGDRAATEKSENAPSKNILPSSKRALLHSRKPWVNPRLPTTIHPDEYFLDLSVDMDRDSYKGEVNIMVVVSEDTDVVIFHEVGLEMINITLKNLMTSDIVTIKNQFKYTPNEFYVIETGSILQKNEQYELTIAFAGNMSTDLTGFYPGYYYSGGTKKKVVSTFFSPISARTAFPCFDEPSFKANFTLTLSHSAQYQAQSNRRPVSTCSKDGVLTTKFNATLKMSTYLLCWVISEYNVLESETDSRISAWADNVEDVRFGLAVSSKLLPFYEDYFNISFPLSKLDIVSIPSFGPGAMENWGIITFRAERILINPHRSTQYLREKSFNIIAHELVHQWFGNLVTMEFWNDAWLKEGFANNIGAIGGHHVDKSMGSKEQVLSGFMLPALEVDAYATSHPISSTVNAPTEIRGVFDIITYNKGSCVVDLLHNYLGDEGFRKGLQSYLKTYAYGNANQDNLWEQLSKVSGKDVKSVMDTWTLQQGYPLISVRRVNESFVQISQNRFSLDPPGTKPPPSQFGYTWKVPVIFKSPATKETVSYLLEGKNATIQIPKHYSIVNPDHALYYRVKYDDAMMSDIKTMLQKTPNLLTAQDRTGIISDQFSFVSAQIVDIKSTLNLLSYLKLETDFYPWQVALEQLSKINYFITSDKMLLKFNRYVANLTASMVQKIGWKNTTSVNEGSLQVLLLTYACQPGSNVYGESEKLYIDWMLNRLSDLRRSLHPVFKDCAISNGPDLFWNWAYLKYENGNADDSLLWSLAATTKMSTIKALLDLSLDNNKIDFQYTPYVVAKLAERSYKARVLCWEFIKKNWDVIIKRYGSDIFMLSDLLSAVLNNFSTQDVLEDIKTFFSNRYVGSGRNAVKQAIHKIEVNIEWKKLNFGVFEEWLDRQGY